MGEFASLPQPQAQDAFVASSARPPAAPRATAAPPVPAVGPGDGAAAGKLFAGMYDAPAAEADADQRVGALLGARGLVGKKAMLLDLLRGTRDAATLRTAFEARTGQPLDQWLDKELGHAATPEKPNADRNEADAILSGDKKSAIAAALANVPKRGGKKKILAVLASAGGDPELIAAARAAWFMQHGTELDEELSVDESAALVEGDKAKAQSFKALDAGEDDDPKEMLAIFRGAKDAKERERRLCECMQTDDPKLALALLQGQYGGKGADGDLLVAVAGGDEIGAAAASVELARAAKDLDKLNESMTAEKNPNGAEHLAEEIAAEALAVGGCLGVAGGGSEVAGEADHDLAAARAALDVRVDSREEARARVAVDEKRQLVVAETVARPGQDRSTLHPPRGRAIARSPSEGKCRRCRTVYESSDTIVDILH